MHGEGVCMVRVGVRHMWGETGCKIAGKEKKCMCKGVRMVKVWGRGGDWGV